MPRELPYKIFSGIGSITDLFDFGLNGWSEVGWSQTYVRLMPAIYFRMQQYLSETPLTNYLFYEKNVEAPAKSSKRF